MKNIKILFLLTFHCLLAKHSIAQIDTRFWFAAPEITNSHDDRPIFIRVSSLAQPAVVTISQPANPAFAPIVQNLTANASASINLTPRIDIIENKPENTVLNFGLLIESTSPITAYYEVNPTINPDIFALKGNNALGTDFFLPMQTFFPIGNYPIQPRGGFDIVATENNTQITVIPSTPLVGHGAGSTFTFTLNRGQTYSFIATGLQGADMPSGTRVTSNKPIAITIKHDSAVLNQCRDLIGDQIVPVDVIGDEYIVMRGFLNSDERFFVTATENNTQISVSGNPVATINAGEVYTHLINTPYTYVSADKPIYVFHVSGFGCEMGGALLPSIKCTGSRNVQFTRSTNEFFGLNIMIRNGGQGNFVLNGSTTLVPASAFSVVPGTNNEWVAAQIDLSGPIPVDQNSVITNTSTTTPIFHLGIINGGAISGCRYGYFSDFGSDINLGGGKIVCFGDSVQIDAGPGQDTYLWNTGATTQSIWVTQPGTYYVTTNRDGCVGSDTVEVNQDFPVVDIQGDLIICPGTVTSLFAGAGFASYEWSNGSTNASIFVGAGTYSVTVTNSFGCSGSDTVIVFSGGPTANFIFSPSPIFSTTEPTSFTDQSTFQFFSEIVGWFWDFGDGNTSTTRNPTHVFGDTGTYVVTLVVTDVNGCTDTISYTHVVVGDISIPNVFTPNGDGFNDTFVIENLINYPDTKLFIYNRWGNLVYKSDNYQNDWDGGSNPAGVYFYVVRLINDVSHKGTVTLIKD
ncbi:MAG: gliding motility-associated C-terminal domain-containing protein [Flavobacteriales bacterium]